MFAAVNAGRMVLASFAADAATMGLHWIYDQGKILDLLRKCNRNDQPEFFEPPSCPFYSYPSGAQSPYGDEQFHLLKFLSKQDPAATREGTFDRMAFLTDSFEYYRSYEGRLNHLTRTLVERMSSSTSSEEASAILKDLNADNNQAHSMNKAVIITAAYGHLDTEKFIQVAKDIITTHQTNELAIDMGIGSALILRHLLLSEAPDINETIDWAMSEETTGIMPLVVRKSIQKVLDVPVDQDTSKAVQNFGLSCAFPHVFEGCIYILRKHPKDIVAALRSNILAGGDNCSRAIFIGAAAAAANAGQIPEEWIEKMTRRPDIMTCIE